MIEGERVRNRNHTRGRHRDELTVPSIDRISQNRELAAMVLQSRQAFRAMPAKVHGSNQNALARFEICDVFTNLGNLPGDIAAQNMRQFYARQSLADPDVEMIEGACLHPHQHLIFARLRIRHVFVHQDFRPSELMNANSFHVHALPVRVTLTQNSS